MRVNDRSCRPGAHQEVEAKGDLRVSGMDRGLIRRGGATGCSVKGSGTSATTGSEGSAEPARGG
jgi:hypothetical protein